MGNIPGSKHDPEQVREFLQMKKSSFLQKYQKPVEYPDLSLNDFKRIQTLGSGSYGNVLLVQKDSKKFAVKVLEKNKIMKLKQKEHVLSEKQVLQAVEFPFIVELAYSFKDNANLYLVLEVISGGEMFTHLRAKRKFSDAICKFYAAQVLLTFEYLHHLDIIYRDLKPENILIDKKGYLKLTDFGFAKVVKERTYTLCGTPDYLAPEIIQNKGYSKAVDWWAFGILLYEMSVGFPPFMAEDPLETYEKIIAGKVRFPRSINEDIKDLIKNLLQEDLTYRYGNLKNGIDDIKLHKWFNKTNWWKIYKKEVTAPFIPPIKNEDDFTNFEQYGPEEEIAYSETNLYEDHFKDF